jgi:hypothetical protein
MADPDHNKEISEHFDGGRRERRGTVITVDLNANLEAK